MFHKEFLCYDKKLMNNISIVEFIKKSPKTELHLHIEGTLEPEQMFLFAKRNNVQISFKNINEVKEAYNFNNLESFLEIYYEGAKVLLKENDFFELTWAYVLKCKEDNIVHTEIFLTLKLIQTEELVLILL